MILASVSFTLMIRNKPRQPMSTFLIYASIFVVVWLLVASLLASTDFGDTLVTTPLRVPNHGGDRLRTL
jgi:hypothetical protein